MRLEGRWLIIIVGIVDNWCYADGGESWKDMVCPRGQFKCAKSGECLDDSLKNDKKKDCKDGTDEYKFDDKDQINWNLLFQKRPDADVDKLSDECGFKKVPTACKCKNRTVLKCRDGELTSVPSGLSKGVKVLCLGPCAKIALGKAREKHIAIPALEWPGMIVHSRISSWKFWKGRSFLIIPEGNSGMDDHSRPFQSWNGAVFLLKGPQRATAVSCQCDLSGNSIETISSDDFHGLGNLEHLILSHSNLRIIKSRAFYTCRKLKEIHLTDNRLETLPEDIFPEENTVEELYLSFNRLTILKPEYFERLGKLRLLKLDNNLISDIVPMTFASSSSLRSLVMDGNSLDKIESNYFTNLSKLQNLILSRNRIVSIESSSFLTLENLQSLTVFGNFISRLHINTFVGLSNLTNLDLRDNSLYYIPKGVLQPLLNLTSIDLSDNYLRSAHPAAFSGLPSLEYVYFDSFHLCGYCQKVRVCLPDGDGISSRENLLENFILRVTVWVVAILACFGNCAVLMGRFILKEDNQIHSFFIKNLSMADLLMGIYLLVIAVHDMRYRGRYLFFDEQWRDSWGCDICGLISTVSSEVSVFTLTVITLDRYICIMYPLTQRKRHLRLAYILMGTVWLFCLTLAAIPIVGLDYFGTYFYRNNAVCIPLLLHEPRNQGWEYSAFIFLGINLGSFMFIAYAYVAMFVSIRRSRMLFRSTNENQERCLMKRFFFIVITDFACWIPIIVLKVAVLLGFEVPENLYGWIVVFILPVNCALNPLLYTLTCKIFKQRFFYGLTNLMWRKRSLFDSNFSVNSTTKSSRVSRRSLQETELEHYAVREPMNNTWTGKMKYKYANGKVVYSNWNAQQCPYGYRPVKIIGK